MGQLVSRKVLLFLVASITVATAAVTITQRVPGAVERTIPQRVPSLSVVERASAIGVAPHEARVPVGETVRAEVYLDAQAIPVNAAQATLRYPANRLELVNLSREGTIFTIWPVEPHVEGPGNITFAGGIPSPGFLGNFGKVFSVTFRVNAPGVTAVEITDALLLANDGFGTDVLSEVRPSTIIGVQDTERRGDINNDGTVDLSDMGILIANWGEPDLDPRADLNGDGVVNSTDMSVLFSEWENAPSGS